MKYDLLVHIDENSLATAKFALKNVTNYLKAMTDKTWNVVVLINGPAACQFTKENTELLPIAMGLAEQGVQFQLCQNAVNGYAVAPETIMDCCTVVPAGMVALVELQNMGYAYVRP